MLNVEWMSIEGALVSTLTDLEFCKADCEQEQALMINVDDSDGNECIEENSPITPKWD
ncbi:hypothetical protein AVEN_274746-1, partial [Araneus ventricosus]